MRRFLVAVAALVAMMGCQQASRPDSSTVASASDAAQQPGRQVPEVGAIIELQGETFLTLDRGDYEEYADLKRAGTDTGSFKSFESGSLMPRHKWTLLDKGSRLRVLARVPDGVKMVVEMGLEHDLVASIDAKRRIYAEAASTRGAIAYVHRDDLAMGIGPRAEDGERELLVREH
jgi:hypothetical protein